MKKKIKKIHNKVSSKVSRGKDLLTVMIIPHTEKRIFTFQVTYFTLFFVGLVIIIIFTVAFFALKKQPETLKNQRIFESTNIEYSKTLNKFLIISNEIFKNENKVKQAFKQLMADSGYQYDDEQSRDSEEREKLFTLINENYFSTEFIEEIHSLMQFGQNVNKIQDNANNIINSVQNFRKLSNSIPSIWPLIGSGIMTSGYGPRIDPFTVRPVFHPGVDISAFAGTPIRATADGIVKAAEFSSGTGNMILIEHKFGFSSAYCHLQKFAVSAGDNVKRGEIIGYVGNTGRSVGYHLHYEVRIQNETTDPIPFLRLDTFQN